MDILQKLVRANALLLQGAYEGAEHVLDGAIVEARSIQSECETLRVRVGEMAAEIERLQGVIDAASAQEPVGKVRKVAHGGPHAFQVYDNLQIGESKVYARPIPAQPSPALETTELFAADQWWVGELNDATKNGTPDQQRAYCVVLNLLRQVKQSPAVAVPDDKHILFLAEKFMPSTYLASENKAILFFAKECIGEAQSMQQPVILDKSPRITEQDALEIINSAVGFMYEESSTPRIDYWLHEEGRALLNKLNGDHNGK